MQVDPVRAALNKRIVELMQQRAHESVVIPHCPQCDRIVFADEAKHHSCEEEDRRERSIQRQHEHWRRNRQSST
jgi:hypothetical protein